LAGTYALDGAYGYTECILYNNGACVDAIWRWVGHAHGSLSFGDTIPGTLHRFDAAGRDDVTVTGTLNGEYIYNSQGVHSACDGKDWACWETNFPTTTMSVLAPQKATLHFSHDTVTGVDFEAPITVTVPNEGKPAAMRFFFVRASPGFTASSQGLTSSLLPE
jgi:hypothetical protein